MSPKRLFLPVVISLSMLAVACHAQTVESVLTALQKRKQAILIRDVVGKEVLEDLDAALDGRPPNYSEIEFAESDLIEWPEGIARFPEAGPNGINDLTKVLATLNHASLVFDEIKLQFLPFDPEAKRFVNEVCTSESDSAGSKLEVPCIQLPSVGVFTEENWRTKLDGPAARRRRPQLLRLLRQ